MTEQESQRKEQSDSSYHQGSSSEEEVQVHVQMQGEQEQQEEQGEQEEEFEEAAPVRRRKSVLLRQKDKYETPSSHGGTDDEDYKAGPASRRRKKSTKKVQIVRRSNTKPRRQASRTKKQDEAQVKPSRSRTKKKPENIEDVDEPRKRAGRPKGSKNKRQSEKGLARQAVKFEEKDPPKPFKKQVKAYEQLESSSSSSNFMAKAQLIKEQDRSGYAKSEKGKAKVEGEAEKRTLKLSEQSSESESQVPVQDEEESEQAPKKKSEVGQESSSDSNQSSSQMTSSLQGNQPQKGSSHSQQDQPSEQEKPIMKNTVRINNQDQSQRGIQNRRRRLVQTNLKGQVIRGQEELSSITSESTPSEEPCFKEPGQQTLKECMKQRQASTSKSNKVLAEQTRLGFHSQVVTQALTFNGYSSYYPKTRKHRKFKIIESESSDDELEYKVVRRKRKLPKESIRRYRKVVVNSSEQQGRKNKRKSNYRVTVDRTGHGQERIETEGQTPVEGYQQND